MKTLLHISICFIVCFTKYAHAQIKFANTLTGVSDQYGISGTTVFKLDANGNSVWVKDFAGQIVSSTFSNVLYGSAFDGKNLYILEMQGQIGSGIPPTMNAAVIKMDTLGNVLFTKYNSVQSPGGYGVTDIFPSFVNGAWIIDNYGSGFTHYGRVFKIGSTGSLLSVLGIWYGSVAFSIKVCPLPDSTYVICSDHRESTGGFGVPFSALIKFDESGSIIWQYSYEILNGTSGEALFEQKMVVDNSGNIYLFENYYGAGTATVGIKINSSGSVVTSKLWPTLAAFSITDLRFENNEIIAVYNNEEIHFDTSLNNSCLNTQNFSIITGNRLVPTTPTHSFSNASFTPSNSAPITHTPSNYLDYCSSLGIDAGQSNKNNFNFYPNPANDKITIAIELEDKVAIEILDLQGKIVLEEICLTESEIDVSKLKAGTYFIRMSNGNWNEKKTLIIER